METPVRNSTLPRSTNFAQAHPIPRRRLSPPQSRSQMTINTIAIVTASSTSGRACLDTLLKTPNPPKINALFRTHSKAQLVRDAYPSAKIDLVTGVDANDPSTVRPGLSGCQSALLVTPHDPASGIANDGQLVMNLINASVEAGVKHIVLVGSWTVNAVESCPALASRFLPGEILLKELEPRYRITWTVLRGGYFQSNYAFIAKGVSEGQLKFVDFCAPAVDPCDIGRVAAAVLLAPEQHHGECYEICGPEKIWFRDVVSTISDVSGKPLNFANVSLEESIADLPPFLKELYEYMVKNGENAMPFSDDVLKITGKQPKSFREWATENHAAFES